MSPRNLTVKILGSGTSTGVPVLGCHCAVCTSTLPQNQRTRCSALVQWQDRNILIDTATDFRQQALREQVEHIDAVLFTHTHADHIHGIDDLRTFTLRSGEAIPVYGSTEAMTRIRQVFSYIFLDESEPGYRPKLELCDVDHAFELFGQQIVPVPLIHGPGFALGYRIGPMAYLTDCSAIPDASYEQLQDLDLLVLDALRFRPHESHFSVAEAITVAQEINARRTLLTHLSHDVDYEKHHKGLPEGIEFAYDGLTIHLSQAGDSF